MLELRFNNVKQKKNNFGHGGADYIGSHMVELLAELNHRVIVLVEEMNFKIFKLLKKHVRNWMK